MSLISTNDCSVPERLLQNFKAFILLAVFTVGTLNVFAQTIDSCDDFTAGAGAAWPYVLTATTVADGAASQAAQTFTMNVTSLPDGGANFRVFKTTANGGNYFGNLTALQLGNNTFTVAAVDFDRAVKFQFSSGEVGFSALSVNAVESGCEVSPPPATSTVAQCGDFASGPAAWPYILEAALLTDGESSQAAQTFTMNVTSVPAGGANFRVYKTTANGGDYFGNLTAVQVGENTITVSAVNFDRAVKFQFSSGDIEFDALSLNGVASDCALASEPEPDPVPGCVDATACNYDESATEDDGSCTYADAGFDCEGNCLEGETLVMNDSYGDGWNGNILTINGVDYTIDSGSNSVVCVPTADCYLMSWTMGSYSSETSWSFMGQTGAFGSAPENMGDCVTDCMDAAAENYNADADIADNSLCTYAFVQGCMDETACNYDASAEQDDGSCTYAAEGLDCEGNCLSGTLVAYTAGSYSYENSFTISDCYGTELASMSSGSVGFNGCVELGAAYTIDLVDSYGDSWNGGNLNVGGIDYTVSYADNGGSSLSVSVGECPSGCTDANATNYDANAVIDDGSCEFDLAQGCIDETACNYDAAAQQDDGSCTYAVEGFDCDGACLSGTLVEYSAGSYAGENSFTITDCDGNELASMASGNDGFSSCIELPDFYYVNLSDSYGDGWNGGALNIGGVSYTIDAGGAWSGFDFESFAPNGECPNVIYSAGSYAGENSFSITDCDGNELASMASGSDGFSAAVDLPENYNINLNDSYGDGWNGGALVVDGVTYTIDAGGAWSGFDSEQFLVGSCGLPGCTDAAACNYNADAELEDGSCTYATATVDCDGNCIVGSAVTISLTDSYGDSWNGGFLNVAGVEYTQVGSYGWPYSQATETFTACVDLDTCTEVVYTPGSYSYENSWSISDADGNVLSSGANESGYLGCPTGCTNPLANNFDLEAVVDDGSCLVCLDGVEVSDSNLPEGELPDDVVTITITTGNPPFAYSGEIHWELYNNGNDLIISGGNALTVGDTDAGGFASGDYDDGEVYERTTGCLPDGCYKLITYDTYGDGWNNNGTFGVTNQFGTELVPTTVMGPTVGFDEDGMGYNSYPQQLATYFSIGDASCETYGCTDELADNYDADATVDDESCIFCDENSVDVTFAFNQENVTSDEVYVYNQETNDTVFSVEPFELATWAGKDTLTCVPVGCYIISMGATSSSGWTDGSQLQILDDLTSDYFFLEVDGGSLDLQVVSIGGAECNDSPVGGCMDPAFDNYNPDATYDNGSCAYTCEGATASNSASVEEDADSAPYSYVTSDPAGFGATVTFETTESDADMIYHIGDCDSTQFTSFNPNLIYLEIEAGVSVYFAAIDAWNTDSVGTIVATVNELPDSSYWGCMVEYACNYDSLATFQPQGSCVFAEVGSDCDGNDFPIYFDIELDYNTSGDLCIFDNDYNETSVGSDYPGFSWNNDGGDIGYAFVSDGNSVSVSLSVTTAGNFTNGFLNIYNGNPLDSVSPGTLVTAESGNSSEDYSLNTIFETDSGNTYFVIVDADDFDCYNYELSINSLEGLGGCTDVLACNYNDSADYNDFTCIYAMDGFDCDGNFTGSACGYDNVLSDSIIVGTGYANNMYQVYEYPSDGISNVSIAWTSGDTENNYDEFAIYDGVGEGAISSANLITEIEDNLPGQYVAGLGNGITMVWSTDGSVNGDESFGNLVWNVYCANYIYGCMDTLAMNYDTTANMADESCVYDFVYGCIDELACNYADTADVDDGSCFYPEAGFDCDGLCLEGSNITLSLFDSYGDGWNGGTLELDGVVYTVGFADNNGDFAIFELCLDLDACYDVTYTAGSWSSENSWSVADASGVLMSAGNVSGSFGSCGVYGCMDATALNYNSEATLEDGTCEYPVSLAVELDHSTSGDLCNHANDYDDSNTAYDPGFGSSYMGGEDNAYYFTADNGLVAVSMVQEEDGTGQPGVFVFDGDPLDTLTSLVAEQTGFSGSDITMTFESNDSTTYYVVVDHLATWGCFAYDLTLTQVYSGCMDSLALNYDPIATIDDGSCEFDFVYGCIDSLACNYADTADVDDGSCIYPASEFVDCDGNCLYSTVTVSLSESWGDNTSATVSVNGDVVVGPGVGSNTACIDLDACISFTYDGNGEYFTNEDSWTVTVDSVMVIDAGGYGTSFGSETIEYGASCPIAGCMDELACNYDSTAEVSNGSCSYAEAGYDCDGLCLVDTDEDGICDEFEVAGCTDQTATNYDPSATDDDGSCQACEANNVTLVMNDSYGDGWNGATFTMVSDENSISASNYPTGSTSSEELCVPDGCYDVTVGGGAYDYEITFSLGDLLSDVQTGTYTNIVVGADSLACEVLGCMDSTASNFNADVTMDDGTCTYSTTFNVDMSCSGVDFTTVHLTGPIWGWTTDIIMTDEDGDGIYSITMDLAAGDIEYKYMVDYWAGQEDLIDDMQNGGTCAPITDYSSYANRQVAAGSTTSDTYGSCTECGADILGCTDEAASNYDPAATLDDGTCDYCDAVTVNFSVDAGNVVSSDYDNVVVNGSFANWNGWGVTLTDDDGDGVYTGSTTVEANVVHEYVHALTGAADGWSGWGVIGYAPEACQLGVSETTGDASPNYYFSGGCGEVIDLPTVCFGECTECVVDVPGCTDASADNFDPNATVDDGSCTFCGSFEAVLLGTSDASAAGSSDGSVQATGQGGSNNYDVTVVDGDGVPQNSFALAAGDYTAVVTDVTSGCESSIAFSISEPVVADNPCDIVPTGLYVDDIIHNRVVFNWSAPSAAPSHYMIRYRAVGTSSWTVMTAGPVNSNEFTGTSRTRYFMEPGTTYEWNIRARVLNEDGSTNCQSSWSASNEYTTLDACANLENLSASTEAVWATLSADAPAAEWGVWQSKGKLRVVGTNSFRYVNGDSDGNISVLKGNFDPSTDYEWHTKAWCTGNVDSEGNSDPMYHSGWGDFSTFSTQAPCDKMPTNLTTAAANNAQTAITMSWDTPDSGAPDHYFLELTNVTTGQVWAWNNIPGTDNSKSKYGLTAGEYSWRIRGACGTNGTSWATIFSQPVTYTLGGARLENGSVANLDVYPNPSRDIFNVSFTSEEAQTMTVKVVNMIGEEIFTEELTEFVGQYTKVIDMNTQPKGVYFLEITTSTGGINKKIVLQ